MKQIKCEICGSTEIKKTDDSTFICLSCGVQYTKDEVQKLLVEINGKVKIDHSEEIKNTIKRAEQFEESGDHIKAKEYYNKALDLDTNNEIIQKKVSDISEKQALDKYYIVDAKIDSKQNIRNFLKQLATENDIACDIYKEIDIKSVTEKYVTFTYMNAKCEYNWSAIVCNRYFENETVYVSKYNDETKKIEKVPQTKQVEKIQRTPRNGSYVYDCNSLNFSSNSVYNSISSDDDSKKSDLLLEFESLQNDKLINYSIDKIDYRQVTNKNGNYFYKGCELDISVEESVLLKKQDDMLNEADRKSLNKVKQQIGGDFYEGLNTKRNVLSKSISYICIPIQIIIYTYKGTDYIAISDLISHTTSIPEIYPSDKTMTVNKSVLTDEKNKNDKNFNRFFLAGVICGIFAFALLFIAGNLNAGFLAIISLVLLVFTLILFFVGIGINANRNKKFNQTHKKIFGELTGIRTAALSKSFETFFSIYDENGSIDEAKKAINVDYPAFSTNAELSPAGKLKEFHILSKENLTNTNNEIDDISHKIETLKVKNMLYLIIGLISCVTIVFLLPGIFMIKKSNDYSSQFYINKSIMDLKYNVINGSETFDNSNVSIEVLDCSVNIKKGTSLIVMITSGMIKQGDVINIAGKSVKVNKITVLRQHFNKIELPKSNVDCAIEKLKVKLNFNTTDDFNNLVGSNINCHIN